MEVNIPFNHTERPASSTQFVYNKLSTFYYDSLSHLTTMPWPVLVWNVALWLGTLSTGIRILKYLLTSRPVCGLANFIISITSYVVQAIWSTIKTTDWYQKKHIIPPRFNVGDNVYGWINMFERHTQDLSETSKKNLILQLIHGDCLEQLEYLLLKEKPTASFYEIKKALIRLFSRHESSLDPMHTLVTRVQQKDENLFQYISILKKIAREAFEIDTIKKDDLLIDRFIRGLKDNRIKEKLCSQFNLSLGEIVEQASIWESKFKKTDTISQQRHSLNKGCSKEDCESTQIIPTNGKRVRFYSTEQASSSEDEDNVDCQPRISKIDSKKVDKSLKLFQVIKPKTSNFQLPHPKPIRGLCKLNDKLVVFDLDTGADISAMSTTVYNSLNPKPRLVKNHQDIISAGGKMENIKGLARVEIQFGIEKFSTYLLVVDDLAVDCLFGRDLLPYSKILKGLSQKVDQSIKKATKLLLTSNTLENKSGTIFANSKRCKRLEVGVPRHSKLPLKTHRLFHHVSTTLTDENSKVEVTREIIKDKLTAISAERLADLGGSEASPIEHVIDLIDPNVSPIRNKVRRVPYNKRAEFKKMLDEMLEAKLIQKSESSWSSPVLLVAKPDGSIRFTVDYSKLNALTVKDAHPLPNSEDLFAQLANSRWYTKFDFLSGYFQLKLSRSSRKLTAFSCEWGLFEYTVMPMGLTNAPATFQRTMNEVLKECIEAGYVLVFLDDILIHSLTLEEHLMHVEKVLEKLKAYNFKLKPKKCDLVKEEVKFLGHIISYGRIKPDPEKIEALMRYTKPSNLNQVLAFLGLAQYYRKFVKDFSKIAAPLYFLTTKEGCDRDGSIKWDENCDVSFNALRTALTSSSFLILPDLNQPFRLDTDACNTGIGAVLSQDQNGESRPAAYFSKGLNKAQKNYSTSEKELLAIVLAIEHFHQYLYGRPFEVFVDHQPLSWLFKCQKPNARLARWLIRLANYDFKIIYRSGKNHCNADALSRWALEEPDIPLVGEDGNEPIVINSLKLNVIRNQDDLNQTTTNFPIDQNEDEDLKWLINLKSSETPLNTILQNELTDAQKALIKYYQQYFVLENKLYFSAEDTNNLKLVLPNTKINKVIELTHSNILSGHLGIKKTKEKIFNRFFRPKLGKAVEEFIKQCEVCQKTKNPTTLPKAPLKSIKCHYPMQLVTMDIVGPLPITSNGNKYILVVCCHFSKFVVLFALADQQAETVANSLLEFILVFGLFTNVLTDQGTNFQSELMKKLYELLDIYQLKTSAYHPQCNGITERFNRTLKTMLSCFSNENQNNWDQLIKKLAFAYNSSVHNATNYTPYELMFGRKPKLPIDLVIRSPEPIVSVDELAENSELSIDQEVLVEPPNPDQSLVDRYVCQIKEHLNEVFKHVEQTQDLKLNKAQWLYNRNIKPHTYVEGDLVLKNVVTVKTGLSKKLSQKWEGPYVIVKRINEQNYQIKQANNHIKSRCRVVHHNRLKKFFGNLSQYPVQNVPENIQMSGKTLHKKRGRKKRLVHQKQSFRTENLIPPQEETASDTTSAPIAEQIHAAPTFFPTQVPPSRNLTDLGARLRKPVDRLTYYKK
ncbi:unnamed protein product [Brachionus calyciflorus]|uniref:RNA-directed DNA polymerase n=1 Tax=Brachionus calyciflorus TaxID=104777 RepID=A0A814KPN7_9BILA|nr:unnamed protein product [Brachionus calyciflorus]